MTFRVTNNQNTSIFIQQMNRNKLELEKVRQELSSGLRVTDPSDDPGRAGTIVTHQSTVQRLGRHQARIDFGIAYLSAQEGALNSTENVLIRMRELATQAANESLSHEQRAQLADEVFQLRDTLASLANTQYEGRYIFGGLNEAPPAAPPVSLTQNYFDQPPTANEREASHYEFSTAPGQDLTREIDISDNERVRINTPARDIFKNAMDAATSLGRALMGYETFVDGAGDLQAAGNNPQLTFPAGFEAQTAQILQAMDAVEQARAEDVQIELSDIGARVNRLEETKQILTTIISSADTSRAGLQDTDAIDAASRFANLQTTLEAVLASGARVNDLTLLDFI